MMDARNYSAQETLKDGLRVTIRAIRPDDGDTLPAAFKELKKIPSTSGSSDRSRKFRIGN
jgi:hypothetical protein